MNLTDFLKEIEAKYFATQHWHICDPEEAQECVINILNDEA